MKPLAVVGNVNTDLILGPAAPWPVPGTEVIVDHDELRVGGCAGNSGFVWQALGLEFQIAANVGSDRFGAWLREAFGIRAAAWSQDPGPTTLSVGITHPDGERTFFTTRGHLARLDWPEVEAMLDWKALKGGYLLVCGTFLTEALTARYDALFAKARAHSVKVALDTGWPLEGWSDDTRADARRWLGHCDCLLLNEVEATALAECQSAEAAAHALRALMPEGAVVVVKCGPDGAIALDASGVTAAAAPHVRVIDTIGAGDVFNAGFLAALAAGQPLDAALRHGVITASTAISTNPRSYGDLPLAEAFS